MQGWCNYYHLFSFVSQMWFSKKLCWKWMLKTVNVSEYFKVQIDTKFPFSFKLIFFSLLVKRIVIYLHVSENSWVYGENEYHSIHSASLRPLIPCLQASVYDKCVEPLVKSCMEGYNVTIFAYGQTVSTDNMCNRQLIYYYSWHLVYTPLLQQSDCVIELPKWAINMFTQRVCACVRSRQDAYFEARHSWLVFETQICWNLDQNGKRHSPIIETGFEYVLKTKLSSFY